LGDRADFFFRKLEAARTKIDSLGIDITKARSDFRSLMDFYAVQPKKANVEPEPKEFFDLWTSFCAEFKVSSNALIPF